MSRAKFASAIALALVFGALFGAGATYAYFMRDAMSGMVALGDLSVASLYETRINLFGDAGSDKDYEASLNEYLSILDRLRAKHPDSPDNASLALSKIITLARLSLVAQKRGGSLESDQFLSSAVNECQSANWRDCSVEQMRKLGLYFENKRVGAPTSK
jgi:hypothetical protein